MSDSLFKKSYFSQIFGPFSVIILDAIWKNLYEFSSSIVPLNFLKLDAYHTDGLPIKATQCDQLFFSSSYITIQDDHNQQISPKSSSLNQHHKGSNEELFSSRTKTNGKFFSPNYPQFYKASMLCKYYFLAHYNERIVIKLNHVQLWSYKRLVLILHNNLVFF